MVRVLQLLEKHADFQTQRSVESLARGLGEDFEVAVRTIGKGGDFRNVADAVLSLRREAKQRRDVIHVWGGKALCAAAVGSKGPIIYSAAGMVGPRSVRWVMR